MASTCLQLRWPFRSLSDGVASGKRRLASRTGKGGGVREGRPSLPRPTDDGDTRTQRPSSVRIWASHRPIIPQSNMIRDGDQATEPRSRTIPRRRQSAVVRFDVHTHNVDFWFPAVLKPDARCRSSTLIVVHRATCPRVFFSIISDNVHKVCTKADLVLNPEPRPSRSGRNYIAAFWIFPCP